MSEKNAFLLYTAYRTQFSYLSMTERGKLITALFDHMNGERLSVPLQGATQMAFSFICMQLSIDQAKYKEACESNAKNRLQNQEKKYSEETPISQEKAEEISDFEAIPTHGKHTAKPLPKTAGARPSVLGTDAMSHPRTDASPNDLDASCQKNTVDASFSSCPFSVSNGHGIAKAPERAERASEIPFIPTQKDRSSRKGKGKTIDGDGDGDAYDDDHGNGNEKENGNGKKNASAHHGVGKRSRGNARGTEAECSVPSAQSAPPLSPLPHKNAERHPAFAVSASDTSSAAFKASAETSASGTSSAPSASSASSVSSAPSASSASSASAATVITDISKKERLDAEFAVFYEAYPRAVKRKKTYLAWVEAVASGVSPAEILQGVEKAKQSDPRFSEAFYIPYSESWLRERGWEDAYFAEPPKSPAEKTPAHGEAAGQRTTPTVSVSTSTFDTDDFFSRALRHSYGSSE